MDAGSPITGYSVSSEIQKYHIMMSQLKGVQTTERRTNHLSDRSFVCFTGNVCYSLKIHSSGIKTERTTNDRI